MSAISLSGDWDVVIQRKSLLRAGITDVRLAEIFEGEVPRGSNSDFVVFGPVFGEEAAMEFRRRLQHAGLEDVDDFFIVDFLVPEWLRLRAEAASG